MWMEGVLSSQLHYQDTLVKVQAIVENEHGLVAIPTLALCPNANWVRNMEIGLLNTENGIITRMFTGALGATTFGVLRWSDLQRSVELKLGKDALMGMST